MCEQYVFNVQQPKKPSIISFNASAPKTKLVTETHLKNLKTLSRKSIVISRYFGSCSYVNYAATSGNTPQKSYAAPHHAANL